MKEQLLNTKPALMVARIALVVCAVVVTTKSWALDAKAKATTCAACHGQNGVSSNEMWPNLAGQKKAYLLKQLKAFKSAERKDPTMNAMAAPLTDEEMEALAGYFASLNK